MLRMTTGLRSEIKQRKHLTAEEIRTLTELLTVVRSHGGAA